MKKLVAHYHPDLLVLEGMRRARRTPRVRKLSEQIQTWAGKADVRVKLVSSATIRRMLLPDGIGTKHDLAAALARHFPESLEHLLPAKRRTWASEDARMGMSQAVALAFMPTLIRRKSEARTAGRS